ncbi:Lambda-crystallin [Trichostrongylus colubriformis]|uniref:Lambda-crystallin n=1 Tax=Trichostrongylus colubriformis TaxID=6319 RepID=A0AAN8EZN6_TRICO
MAQGKGKVAIVGSGLIGSCWATLFVSAGYSVCLYDISDAQLEAAKKAILHNLHKLKSEGLSRGTTTVEEATGRISTTLKLSEALVGAIYAQESTCETVEFKKKIFAEMDKCASSEIILGSSTSTIPASKFTEDLTHRSQCIVAHPVNPPLYLTLVEMVPAPWTHDRTIQKACKIMESIGQEPVRLHREVLGFAVNRLQYALLAEAWRLVGEDVLSPEDVDKVMSAGLGPRYAIHGPLQTVHLNANGVRDYFVRYGDGIRRVLADQGPMPTFKEAPVLEKLENYLNHKMPLDQLAAMKAERERNLARLASLKKKME